MAPKTYFDENPYKNDRPLPGAKKGESRKEDLKPFKPSSPGKVVSEKYMMINIANKLSNLSGHMAYLTDV